LDVSLYDELLDATNGMSGRDAVMLENSHWGEVSPYEPNSTWCPWNIYRTSTDVRSSFKSVVRNLQTTIPYAEKGLSHPGCWAYPDMLLVGAARRGTRDPVNPGLSNVEQRTQFNAWAIVSSPLILSLDVTDDAIMDAAWPVIANKEVIEVNQAWAGHSGTAFKSSEEVVDFSEPLCEDWKGRKGATSVPSFQYFYKPLEPDGVKTAVLMMNNGDDSVTLSLDFADVPGVSCTKCHVREIVKHRNLGVREDVLTDVRVGAHDAAFFVITSAAEKAESRRRSGRREGRRSGRHAFVLGKEAA